MKIRRGEDEKRFCQKTVKLLTIAVPAYNSEAYLDKCLESLTQTADARLEIIIVNDGSKDQTEAIAQAWAERFPELVRVVSKENGGHGSAVNRGLKEASGRWYYVVDSDDRLDPICLTKVLDRLESFEPENPEEEPLVDLYLVNYVYDKVGETPKPIAYVGKLPVAQKFAWTSMKRLGTATFLTMHSTIYRTKLLRDVDLVLPEHCFYVDNILAYKPLPAVRTLYYDNYNLYWYFIGRDDQSVAKDNLIRRIDQQIRVTKLMVSFYDLKKDVEISRLRNYMLSYLSMMMTISTVHLLLAQTAENDAKSKALWQWLKAENPSVYRYCRLNPINSALLVPGRAAKKAIKKGYELAQKLYKFN